MTYIVIMLVIGYIFGCCQTGYFIGKLNQIDIRKYGSGNSGTTNTLRVLGKKAAGITFLGDALKGVFAVLVARLFIIPHITIAVPAQTIMLLAGFAAILGHDFPVHMKFKGGKGIATTAGVMFAIDPRLALICFLIFTSITAATRYVSLASCIMVFTIPFQLWLFYGANPYVIGPGVAYAVLAIWRHRANIGRLLNGTESKLGEKVEH
jgi:glycerol-3-phosphate acyltransferase PlsY